MEKHFNTAGPSKAHLHYQIDPLSRVDRAALLSLVRQERYLVLHAPRQTGKTTCLLALRDELNAGSEFHAVYANIEAAQAFRSQVEPAMDAILDAVGVMLERVLGPGLIEAARRAAGRRWRRCTSSTPMPLAKVLPRRHGNPPRVSRGW
jgi:hypothetical protein